MTNKAQLDGSNRDASIATPSTRSTGPYRRLLSEAYRSNGIRGLRRAITAWSLGRAITAWSQSPDYLLAADRLFGLPQVNLAEIVPLDDATPLPLSEMFCPRAEWSLGPLEQAALVSIVRARSMSRILEIGTFDGGTTALLAEAVGASGKVTTVDLPSVELSKVHLPAGFEPDDIGHLYRAAGLAARVNQLRVDSADLSIDELGGGFDLVFVDACHDYAHGRNDAELALQVVGKDGLVVFDDMHPWFGGLVLGVTDAAKGHDLRMLSGTKLGIILS